MLGKVLKRLQQPSLYVKLAITREQSLIKFSLQIHESKSKNQNPRERAWLEAYIEAVS